MTEAMRADVIELNRDEAALVAQWAQMVVQEFGPHLTGQGRALAERIAEFGDSRA